MQLTTDRHHLLKEDGALFFYCADTAWEIFHKLTYKEAQDFIEKGPRKPRSFSCADEAAPP